MTTASRPDGRTRNGGARPGSGPLQVRFRLHRERAQELRVLMFARRGVTGDSSLSEDDMLDAIIRREYAEYEAGLTAHEE